jgi:hypothetical protein
MQLTRIKARPLRHLCLTHAKVRCGKKTRRELTEGRSAPVIFYILTTGTLDLLLPKKRLVFSGFTQTKGTGIHYKRGLSDRRIDIKYGVFSTPSFKYLFLRFILKRYLSLQSSPE